MWRRKVNGRQVGERNTPPSEPSKAKVAPKTKKQKARDLKRPESEWDNDVESKEDE